MSECTTCGARGLLRRGLCPKHYTRLLERQTAYGCWESTRVPAQPVREHVEALHDAGVSYQRIADLAGVSRDTLTGLRLGHRGRPRPAWVMKPTADRVLAVPVPAVLALVAPGSRRVSALGSRRRLQALVAAGWPQLHLAGRLGMTHSNMGKIVGAKYSQVTARRHRDVLALWSELQMQCGPSDQARAYAAERQWPLPLQWDEDDLDDPAAVAAASPQPTAIARKPQVDQAAVAAEYEHARTQLGMGQVAALRYIIGAFDISPRTMRRWGYDVSLIEAAERTQRDQQRRRAA